MDAATINEIMSDECAVNISNIDKLTTFRWHSIVSDLSFGLEVLFLLFLPVGWMRCDPWNKSYNTTILGQFVKTLSVKKSLYWLHFVPTVFSNTCTHTSTQTTTIIIVVVVIVVDGLDLFVHFLHKLVICSPFAAVYRGGSCHDNKKGNQKWKGHARSSVLSMYTHAHIHTHTFKQKKYALNLSIIRKIVCG